MATDTPPKLFVSYSWTSPAHEEWVIALATELRESGVDVVLDKWDLKEGHDANAFMEKMAADPAIKKVAMICDRIYAEKADGRRGGVGTETQIISAEVYAKQDQTKFVAVLPERDESGNPFLPTYYKSRVYIDLSSPELYGRNFEQLLRWAFDKPLHVKPEIGTPPPFLQDQAAPSMATTVLFRRALESIREGRTYSAGAVKEYFEALSGNLERFRLVKDAEEFDDKVVQSIEQFMPYRNEAVEIFMALAQYRNTEESWESIHKLFENLMPYLDRPESVTQWQEWDWDNLRFMVHELFMYAIAALLRRECFSAVGYLLRQHYYVDMNARQGKDPMVSFAEFRQHLDSLDHRNKRLKLRRLSLHADILNKRSTHGALTFSQVMQADFVLFIRDCLDSIRTGRWQHWWPMTLIYSERHYGPFEIFARSQSARYFEKTKTIFDITTKEDFLPLAEAFKTEKLRIPRWEFHTFNPFELMAYDKLSTLP